MRWSYRLQKGWIRMNTEGTGLTVVLYGPSGCGKSTLARTLCKAGFDRIRQLTTREPRIFEGSQPGVIVDEKKLGEYDFVSETHYTKLVSSNAFAENTLFEKIEGDTKKLVAYGSLLWEYKRPGYHVVTTNIEGAAQLAANPQLAGSLMFVELCVPRGYIMMRAAKRGRDSLDEIIRRSVNEKKLYYNCAKWDIFPEGYFPDIILYDDDLRIDSDKYLFGRFERGEERWKRVRGYWYSNTSDEEGVRMLMDEMLGEILVYISNWIGSEGSEVAE